MYPNCMTYPAGTRQNPWFTTRLLYHVKCYSIFPWIRTHALNSEVSSWTVQHPWIIMQSVAHHHMPIHTHLNPWYGFRLVFIHEVTAHTLASRSSTHSCKPILNNPNPRQHSKPRQMKTHDSTNPKPTMNTPPPLATHQNNERVPHGEGAGDSGQWGCCLSGPGASTVTFGVGPRPYIPPGLDPRASPGTRSWSFDLCVWG